MADYQADQDGQKRADQEVMKKRVITWLTDAYGMETEGAKTLEQHADAAEGYADVQAKLRQHAKETRQHAEKLKGCLQRLGSQPSAAKEAVGTFMSTARGLAPRAAKDTVVKNILADYASEHFEIICYRSLIAAAEEVEDQETAQVCRDILKEEEAMVESLDEQIAPVTKKFMNKEASDAHSSKQGSKQDADKQKGLVGGAKQNVPLIAGVLVAAGGAGLLLTQALKGNSEKQQKNQSIDGSSGSQQPYGAQMDGGYQTTQQPYAQPALVTPTTDMPVTDMPVADMQVVNTQVTDMQVSDDLGLESSLDGLQGQGLQDQELQGEVFEVDEILGSTDEARSGFQGSAEVEEYPTGNPTADEIMARLKQHRQVDNSDIEVTVEKNGRVTLKGFVKSSNVKRQAEEAIASVLSVSEIRNQIKVKS